MNCNEELGEIRSERLMELFFRALKGEELSVKQLALEYGISSRSITRDINSLKSFFAEHREMIGSVELIYSGSNHCYSLSMDSMMTNKELLAVTKVLIGSRSFRSDELISVISKLKQNTSTQDRVKLDNLIRKEIYNYSEIHFDCTSVIDTIWKLSENISRRQIISINYIRMDRKDVRHRICPDSIMFSEYYFYLIAYKIDENGTRADSPTYFRVDRITNIISHRETYNATPKAEFDEGLLRKRSMYMFPGKIRNIRFEFSGPSLQAIIDKIPTSKVTDWRDGVYTIDAEVYGDGIKMFLLSQGSWVKVISPSEFVDEMREEIKKMSEQYNEQQESI